MTKSNHDNPLLNSLRKDVDRLTKENKSLEKTIASLKKSKPVYRAIVTKELGGKMGTYSSETEENYYCSHKDAVKWVNAKLKGITGNDEYVINMGDTSGVIELEEYTLAFTITRINPI